MEIPLVNPIAEGKTKRLYEVIGRPDTVRVESKDTITAGDGARSDTILDKGAMSTATTVKMFQLLDEAGVPNHYIDGGNPGEASFLAERLTMVPVEVVVRRVSRGSYCQRYPDTTLEGERFKGDDLVVEFFYKGAPGDPFIMTSEDGDSIELHDAHLPLGKGKIEQIPMDDDRVSSIATRWEQMAQMAKDAFLVLEQKWKDIDVLLDDMKVECGINSKGDLVIGDVIDNDSWRLRIYDDKAGGWISLDKDVYRRDEPLEEVAERYRFVAALTELLGYR